MHLQDHIEDAAKELAGNWREIERDPMSGFVYHNPPFETDEEGASWCLVYTSTRDSGLMAQSNEAVMEKELEGFFGGSDINRIRHGHWGPGHLDGQRVGGPRL